MTENTDALYRALSSRDPRFDGIFFVGVVSTGIYCRPICPARKPKRANCRFFRTAAAAEKARFRPCLRCRPELAPGAAPIDDAQRIAAAFVRHMDEGLLDGGIRLEKVASTFEISARQMRRIVHRELGASPIDLILTRRLLLAKQLLTETPLPVTQIAYASGFSSLRRFNDAFSSRYGMPPTRLRKNLETRGNATSGEAIVLKLSYREPYEWSAMLDFFRVRALRDVERVDDDAYTRTVRLGGHEGWFEVRNCPDRSALTVRIAHSLAPVLPSLLGKVRRQFDLDARPDIISSHLQKDNRLTEAVRRRPGLRVPGAFDSFELAVRAILGQQISIKAATTLAARYVDAFGSAVSVPGTRLSKLTPPPDRIAQLSADDLAELGIVKTRARSIVRLAADISNRRLELDDVTSPEVTIRQLTSIPGIGGWTAHYIAMRALHWPDAFPGEDVVLRRALGNVSGAQADSASQSWRPWRSYATLHLWNTATNRPDNGNEAVR